MAKLEHFERWKWLDADRDQEWQKLYENHQPFNAVVEHGPLCGKCGRQVEVLFFDPRINTKEQMREAAQHLIQQARQRVEKDTENRCENHNLRWGLM